MCGFFIISGPSGSLPSEEALNRAMDTMKLRGPDDAGLERYIAQGRKTIIGHRRLSVTGIENGRQPLIHGSTISAVNGEFYDWRETRTALSETGIRFNTESDSEILPALYENARKRKREPENGKGWLSELRGEWAFAMLDRASGAIWAGCDEWGTKPLRWWLSPDGRTFAAATEAKTLFALGISAELDDEALRFAMQFQYLPWGRTLFKNIKMVPPGGYLKFSEKGIQEGRHFDYAMSDEPSGTTEHDVREAVRKRIPDERSFCTHLSGGIDSAIITALSVRLTGRRISGYCASFPWAETGDETPDAEISAHSAGAEFCPVFMDPAMLLSATDEAPFYSEGLSNNLHAGAKILVARRIRDDGYRVALTGEGADEAFLGYEHFRYDFPAAVRPADTRYNPLSAGILRPPDTMRHEDIYGMTGSVGGVPAWVSLKNKAGSDLRDAFGERLLSTPFRGENAADLFPVSLREKMKSITPPARARLMWMMYGMSGYILRGLDDPMGMCAGVESRLPFLDRKLQAGAAAASDISHYAPDGLEKNLLREAARDYLSPEILARPKKAFLVPSVLGTEQGIQWARERLLGGNLIQSGLFTQKGLEHILLMPAAPVRDAAIYTLASLVNLMNGFRIN